jgi:hypothetical protein
MAEKVEAFLVAYGSQERTLPNEDAQRCTRAIHTITHTITEPDRYIPFPAPLTTFSRSIKVVAGACYQRYLPISEGWIP